MRPKYIINENVVQQAVLQATGDQVSCESKPPTSRSVPRSKQPGPLPEMLRRRQCCLAWLDPNARLHDESKPLYVPSTITCAVFRALYVAVV